MKALLIAALVSLAATPALASNHLVNADGTPVVQQNVNQGKGGFVGPAKSKRILRDVISAMNASDDTKVELMGNLTMSLGDEDYVFQDATGEITVEIDDDLWYGRTVTPNDTIVIRGEVEKDWNKVSIDTDSLEVVK